MARLGAPRVPGVRARRLPPHRRPNRRPAAAASMRPARVGARPRRPRAKGEYRKELRSFHSGRLGARAHRRRAVRGSSPSRRSRATRSTAIEVVVDRLKLALVDRARLVESLERAARLGKDAVVVHLPDGERYLTYSTERGCPDHPRSTFPSSNRDCSVQRAAGRLPARNGLGGPGAVRPDDGCLPWRGSPRRVSARSARRASSSPVRPGCRCQVLQASGSRIAPVDKPLGLAGGALHRLVHGDPAVSWTSAREREDRSEVRERAWRGLLPMVETVWHYTSWPSLAAFRSARPARSCDGQRLNRIARAVTFRGKNVPELVGLSVHDALSLLPGPAAEGRGEGRSVSRSSSRSAAASSSCCEVGLGYLTLDRSAATLSGGEAQRIRLAAQLGAALTGVTLRARRALDRPARARQPAPARRARAPARPRQHGRRGRARRRRPCARADHVVDVGPGRGPPRRPHRAPRAAARVCARRHRHRAAPARRAGARGPEAAAQAATATRSSIAGARAQQPEGHRRAHPARAASRWSPASPARASRSLVNDILEPALPRKLRGRARRGRTRARRAGADRQAHRDRPGADRPHAALEPGHLHRACSTRSATSSPPAGGARARLRARAASRSTSQGGRCEACDGAGVTTSRCSSCAGRRALRGVRRQALPRRDARGARTRARPSPTCST